MSQTHNKPLVLYSQAASHRAVAPLYTALQLLVRWKTADTGARVQARKIMRDAGLDVGDSASLNIVMSLLAPEDDPPGMQKITFAEQKAKMCDIIVGVASRRPVLLVVEVRSHERSFAGCLFLFCERVI